MGVKQFLYKVEVFLLAKRDGPRYQNLQMFFCLAFLGPQCHLEQPTVRGGQGMRFPHRH